MPAADLREAAGLAFAKLLPRALAGTLSADLMAFTAGFKGSFTNARSLDHPVINWVSILESIAKQATGLTLQYNGGANAGGIGWLTAMPYEFYQGAGSAIFRLCWLANNMEFVGQITPAQNTAILTSYNAHIF
jgi:hypothetical protein